MRILNLGIFAHVDAGKTSLTERLLFAAGVVDAIGRVDDGTTQTDSLALERQRGITIKAAVVSFVVEDVTVNLIDTPGHPDFIAEVERVLGVLDGAVLVISAVEGVQAQTRVLMRTLQRLGIPTLLFVNKIDRRGADDQRVLAAISERLTPAIIAMGTPRQLGTRDASFTPYDASDPDFAAALADLLADRDDALLAAYLADEAAVSYQTLRRELAVQTAQALVHPVYFGSAITGAGVDALTVSIAELLPAVEHTPDGPPAGTVFKIERGPAGEKIAYARMTAGTLRVRDRLQLRPGTDQKVTAIGLFERGAVVQRPALSAGQIGKLWGLAEVQIGDTIGGAPTASPQHYFAPPTLESVVVPRRPTDKGTLHAALAQLAEQDPLIGLRQDDSRQELSVSLYGEVQKEVIQATLATEYGVEVYFRETTAICVERPAGVGAAVEYLGKGGNPFCATLGLRVEPAPVDSGLELRLDLDLGTIPLYVYKSVEEFQHSIEQTVRETLREGLYGWQVTDCLVTVTHTGYVSPSSTAGDFRKLTPLVLMAALAQAGTVVCLPIHRYQLELPSDTLGATLPLLARLHAVPTAQELRTAPTSHRPQVAPNSHEPRATPNGQETWAVPTGGDPRRAVYLLTGEVPVSQVHQLQQQLPALTRGEGVLETAFQRYKPIAAPSSFPTRPRTDRNPLNRKEYLLHVNRRA